MTKVSGEGADSVFMGVFKYHEEDHSLVRAYCSPTGELPETCCLSQGCARIGGHSEHCVSQAT